MPQSQLQHRTLAAALTMRLREAIVSGAYPAGAALRQDALAKEFGVSRIPLREALQQLESEGLVVSEPHKGSMVAPLSRVEIEDVFAIRRLLEPRLLAASLPLLDAADIAAIAEAHEHFVAATARGDLAKLGAANMAFHLALYTRAELPRSQGIVSALMRASERYTRTQLATAAALTRAVSEHAALLALAQKGDVVAATTLLDDHIAAVCRDLIRLAG